MDVPSPRTFHGLAVKSASAARFAASMMGGGVTAEANTKLGLTLAYSNAGRFSDAYAMIDKLADEQLAWAPCMVVLRTAQAAFGNSAGVAGEIDPCAICGTSKPAVFEGERLCLACLGGPAATKVTKSGHP